MLMILAFFSDDYLFMREIGICHHLGISLNRILKDAQDLSREDSSYTRMSNILENILKQSYTEQNKFLNACVGICYLDLLMSIEGDLKASIKNIQYISPVRVNCREILQVYKSVGQRIGLPGKKPCYVFIQVARSGKAVIPGMDDCFNKLFFFLRNLQAGFST